MDYNTIEKDMLKDMLKEQAEIKKFKLPQGWATRSHENMAKLMEEIDAFIPEIEDESSAENVEEAKKQVYGKPKIVGLSEMKRKLLAQETVAVEVPMDEISKTNHVNIWVNGVEFIYARGDVYEMPVSVAEAYMWSKKETQKAKKKMSDFVELNT